MKWMRSIEKRVAVFGLRLSLVGCAVLVACVQAGCEQPPPKYGNESQLTLVSRRRQTWAIAPAVNLSGQRHVDAILQADLLYQQLQQVKGLTVLPVNRVAEVYAAMRIEQVQSEEQAAAVCELLGCDGLLVPTVTAYDPYDPPKMGASLQLLGKPGGLRSVPVNVHELPRKAGEQPVAGMPEAMPAAANVVQSVGMFDSANGTTRDALTRYAAGRFEPLGPYGAKEYLVSMDRYCGFVYHELIVGLLNSPRLKPS